MATDTSSEETAASVRLSPIATGLCALWVVMPAVQYVGAVRRTDAVVARQTPEDALSQLDLTPWYIILLGLTLVYVTLRLLAGRSPERPLGGES